MLQPGAASSDASQLSCAAGYYASFAGGCTPCASGSYAPDSWPRATCIPCMAGRVAPRAGSAFCATCPDGTRAVDGVRCEPCPNGTVGCVFCGRMAQRAALTRPLNCRVTVSSAEGRAPAQQTCAHLPALPQGVQRLLNESRAFDPRQGEAARAAAALTRAEDLAEQLLYEAQALELPARRRLMPRAYGFAAPTADNTSSLAVPTAEAPTRGVFGWPSGWRADAAAASCICLVAAAAAGAAFALGVRRRQARANSVFACQVPALTRHHCRLYLPLLLMRQRPGSSARATATAGALERRRRRATARTTATLETGGHAAAAPARVSRLMLTS